MRPLPKGVVLKLRSKGIQAAKRAPGPQVDEWDDIAEDCYATRRDVGTIDELEAAVVKGAFK